MKIRAALTFDDGYLSHYNVAKFIFNEGILGTFFIITHLKYFEEKPLLTLYPRLIQIMSDMGHEIGSHSCTHPNLTKLSKRELENELENSKKYLETLLNKKIDGFAFPYGFYNKDVLLNVIKYYRYSRLGGRRYEAKTWNAQLKSRYLIESISCKELFKLPAKYLKHHSIRPVIIFHDDPPYVIRAVVRYLRSLGAEFVPLGELFDDV